MVEFKDLAGLSEPASKLIDKVSDAIGGIAKPWQIVRTAKAEAKADIIRAEAAFAVAGIEQRALCRFVNEEIQKQDNIESITNMALPQLLSDADPEQIDDDWVVNFFEKCRIISNHEMQRLWAKILAGEANSPGTFSKKTVNILSDIDKSDAEYFTLLCRYCMITEAPTPFIFKYTDSIYSGNGISFNILSHLEALGLIQVASSVDAFVIMSDNEECKISYFDTDIVVTLKDSINKRLDVGGVLLTSAGGELFHVCKTSPVDGFVEYILNKLNNLGYKTRVA